MRRLPFCAAQKMALTAIGTTAQEIQAGDGTILLVSPASPGEAAAKFLSGRGESVMGVSIEVQSLEKTRSVLKQGLHQNLSVVVPESLLPVFGSSFLKKRNNA